MNDFPRCVGCGYCCWKIQCPLSQLKYGMQDQCPDFYWDDDLKRHFCKLAKEHADDLHIGAGCSSSLNSWRRNVKDRTKRSDI